MPLLNFYVSYTSSYYMASNWPLNFCFKRVMFSEMIIMDEVIIKVNLHVHPSIKFFMYRIHDHKTKLSLLQKIKSCRSKGLVVKQLEGLMSNSCRHQYNLLANCFQVWMIFFY